MAAGARPRGPVAQRPPLPRATPPPSAQAFPPRRAALGPAGRAGGAAAGRERREGPAAAGRGRSAAPVPPPGARRAEPRRARRGGGRHGRPCAALGGSPAGGGRAAAPPLNPPCLLGDRRATWTPRRSRLQPPSPGGGEGWAWPGVSGATERGAAPVRRQSLCAALPRPWAAGPEPAGRGGERLPGGNRRSGGEPPGLKGAEGALFP